MEFTITNPRSSVAQAKKRGNYADCFWGSTDDRNWKVYNLFRSYRLYYYGEDLGEEGPFNAQEIAESLSRISKEGSIRFPSGYHEKQYLLHFSNQVKAHIRIIPSSDPADCDAICLGGIIWNESHSQEDFRMVAEVLTQAFKKGTRN